MVSLIARDRANAGPDYPALAHQALIYPAVDMTHAVESTMTDPNQAMAEVCAEQSAALVAAGAS